MGRHLKYPKLADLKLGEQLVISYKDEKEPQRVRASLSNLRARGGPSLTVLVNQKTRKITVTREHTNKEEYVEALVRSFSLKHNLEYQNLKKKVDAALLDALYEKIDD